MRWNIAANFFTGKANRWLDDFIHHDDLEFKKIPAKRNHDWHRGADTTRVGQWMDHLFQAKAALDDQPYGIVTCFPQLAFCVALLRSLGLTRAKIVAHHFNLGSVSGYLRGRITGLVLSQVDLFLVHSPSELFAYSTWLGLPKNKFRFVPLQRGDARPAINSQDRLEPYIVAMGSAHRDYVTLINAVRKLELPTVIVCKASIARKLEIPSNVEILTELSREECWALAANARMSITPISNIETASGQITFIDAMRLGTPVLATRCPGTEGYIVHRKTGILVEPFDVEDMCYWIEILWNDSGLRNELKRQARIFYEKNLSDTAAAETLRDLLLTV